MFRFTLRYRESTRGPSMTEPRKPGRPRIHDSAADRVRAHRERKRAEAAAAELPAVSAPADPETAATTLVEAVPLLRREAETAVTRLTAVARQIAAAVDVLGDYTALDTHLRRAQTEAAKIPDAADAELDRLTRAHAEATAHAADAHAEELARLADEHTAALDRCKTDLETATAEHTAQVAELHTTLEQTQTLLRRAESERLALTEQLEQTRIRAERDAATIERLETDLTSRREATTAERDRTDTVREDLATARIELAEARAQTAAARERTDELRTEV